MTDAEISNRIAELQKEISKLEEMRSLNYWNSRENDREKKSAAYRHAKQQAEANGEFIKNYLLVGHQVKVTGSRSRNKYRKIVKKSSHEFSGQHFSLLEPLPIITSHGYSKITEIYHEGKWLKTKDFIKEINRLVA